MTSSIFFSFHEGKKANSLTLPSRFILSQTLPLGMQFEISFNHTNSLDIHFAGRWGVEDSSDELESLDILKIVEYSTETNSYCEEIYEQKLVVDPSGTLPNAFPFTADFQVSCCIWASDASKALNISQLSLEKVPRAFFFFQHSHSRPVLSSSTRIHMR